MGLKTKELRVGGLRIETTQFAAVQAYRLWARLLPLVAPALARLPSVKSLRVADLGDLDVAAFMPALAAVTEQLTPDAAESLMLEILAGTEASFTRGKKPARLTLSSAAAIDEAFDGDVGSLLKTMKHALEVNFAGFGTGASAEIDSGAPPQKDAE